MYHSFNEALFHGVISSQDRVKTRFVDPTGFEQSGPEGPLEGLDAVLVPGGFGVRGTEGKITAVRWAREKKIPFFGICLGLQMAMVEFARNVMGKEGANSLEFDERSPHPVISLIPGEDEGEEPGAMRLGAYACKLVEGTLARKLYGKELVHERHRHRYEVNPA